MLPTSIFPPQSSSAWRFKSSILSSVLFSRSFLVLGLPTVHLPARQDGRSSSGCPALQPKDKRQSYTRLGRAFYPARVRRDRYKCEDNELSLKVFGLNHLRLLPRPRACRRVRSPS